MKKIVLNSIYVCLCLVVVLFLSSPVSAANQNIDEKLKDAVLSDNEMTLPADNSENVSAYSTVSNSELTDQTSNVETTTYSTPLSSTTSTVDTNLTTEPQGDEDTISADKNGWYQEDGNYYFYRDGNKVRGWFTDENNYTYYLDENTGARHTGEFTSKDGLNYYFDKKTGVRLENNWREEGTARYFYQRDGVRADQKWILSPSDNKWYYFNKYGVMQINQWVRNKYNPLKWYFVGEDGSMYVNRWLKSPGDRCWYYVDYEGEMLTYRWIQNKYNPLKWYFVGKDGRMCTRWLQSPGDRKWYYLAEDDGAMLRSAWILSPYNHRWYYVGEDGRMYSDRWLDYKERAYYLLESGAACQNGTYNFAGRKLTFDSNGALSKSQDIRYVLQESIAKLKSQYNITASVSYRNLDSGLRFDFNDQTMYPASIIKALVAAAYLDNVDRNVISRSAKADRDLRTMITISSNDGYNRMLSYIGNGNFELGCQRVNSYIDKIGLSNSEIHHTVMPTSVTMANDGTDKKNASSASDMANFMEKLVRGQILSPKHTKELMNILADQVYDDKLTGSVPKSVKHGNKTGYANQSDADYSNDVCYVLESRNRYVASVFLKGPYRRSSYYSDLIKYQFGDKIYACAR